MSETVKLIIEIDPHIIYAIQNNTGLTLGNQIDMCNAIKDGIPLDDVKAEFINRYPKNFAGEPELGGYACGFSLNKVLKILDNIGKESEVKPNEQCRYSN